MDEPEAKPTPLESNPFLSRGCVEPPRIGHKNDGIFSHRCSKFDTFNWLEKLPVSAGYTPPDVVEVRFKNSRKDFFRTTPDIELRVGDIVAVEASPGHDIGIVSMTGEIVRLQMRNRGIRPASEEIRKVYRRARISDVEKWIAAVELENSTMFKSREMAEKLGLSMKINDVEYQGDNTKAIFYYTADDRVDFRELIKVLAEEFKVRIEMKQIGARQEASRLGGIGSCGRGLCCSTWLSHFHSVTTQAARVQQLSMNPQKLAGQCGKLKCCLNYEYETYVDALKDFPDTDTVLKTRKGDAFHQKTDIFNKLIWYSYAGTTSNQMAIPVDQVIQVIEQNKKGIFPENLEDLSNSTEQKTDFENGNGPDDLSYLDHS
ncbi:MAG: regulatory iron-sulfur-containing complex subunit RicT [bacterium]